MNYLHLSSIEYQNKKESALEGFKMINMNFTRISNTDVVHKTISGDLFRTIRCDRIKMTGAYHEVTGEFICDWDVLIEYKKDGRRFVISFDKKGEAYDVRKFDYNEYIVKFPVSKKISTPKIQYVIFTEE